MKASKKTTGKKTVSPAPKKKARTAEKPARKTKAPPGKKAAETGKTKRARKNHEKARTATKSGAPPPAAEPTGVSMQGPAGWVKRKRVAQVDARYLAARLQVSRGNHPSEGEVATTGAIAGAGGDTPGMTDLPEALQPYLKEVYDELKRLLDEPGYVPDKETILGYQEEILRVLASMPFRFRRSALRLYKEGIRYFGKVPVAVEPVPENPASREDYDRLFRHIGCPEGPGEGRQFALAWLVGARVHVLDPRENSAGTAIDEELLANARKAGLGFMLDHGRAMKDLHGAPEYIERFSNHPLLNQGEKEYYKELADKIRAIPRLDPELKRVATDAFACGVLYSTRVLYPDCRLQYDEKWLSKECVWRWIVVLGLVRHGLELDRKGLLKALGCANYSLYTKSGGALAEFDPEHSRFTPPISFSSYNKAFKGARDWLKSNDGTHTPTRDMIIGSYLQEREAQSKKSEEQRKRNETARANAELAGKTREEKRKKVVLNAKQEQDAAEKKEREAKMVKATRDIR